MNQKGTNSNNTGGICFGEIDTSNNFTQTMFLQSNGYLGIGTTTPTNALDVVGNIRFSSNLVSSNSNFYWNSTSNYLGIGTSNPSYPLHNTGITYTGGLNVCNYYTVSVPGLHLQWNRATAG